MSSDLLAEFDSFYQAPQNATSSGEPQPNVPLQTSAFDDLSFFQVPAAATMPAAAFTSQLAPPTEDAEDIWGNFGDNTQTQTQISSSKLSDPWGDLESLGQPSHTSFPTHDFAVGTTAGDQTFSGDIPRPGIARASTIELFSSNVADLAESRGKTNDLLPRNSTSEKPTQKGHDILFDAADELAEGVDDDEFGDFETVTEPDHRNTLEAIRQPPRKSSNKLHELSLSSNNLKAEPFPYPQAPKSPSFQERNPFADLSLKTRSVTANKANKNAVTESPVTAWPVYQSAKQKPASYQDSPIVDDTDDQEEWGDFADMPPETPAKLKKGKQVSDIKVDAWAWDAVDNTSAPTKDDNTQELLPPTNIPPPSVLLEMFPQLLTLARSTLLKSVADQPFAVRNRILSDPSTIEFLRAYILLAIVGARIISGRKLRWKRDNFLSQAMRIGPSTAGGKGGMKLTGIDKAESTREDREVSEVVRIWKEQVGRLHSAVAAANSSLHDQSAPLVVPEIQEVMPIKTATMAEGALQAPKACALCGLKRDERIVKVDNQAEDSFGEWWIEHWGHRACKNFWLEHESKLRQR